MIRISHAVVNYKGFLFQTIGFRSPRFGSEFLEFQHVTAPSRLRLGKHLFPASGRILAPLVGFFPLFAPLVARAGNGGPGRKHSASRDKVISNRRGKGESYDAKAD